MECRAVPRPPFEALGGGHEVMALEVVAAHEVVAVEVNAPSSWTPCRRSRGWVASGCTPFVAGVVEAVEVVRTALYFLQISAVTWPHMVYDPWLMLMTCQGRHSTSRKELEHLRR